MSTAMTEIEREVAMHFVTLGYVARLYDVPPMTVWRAAKDGRLSAVWVRTNHEKRPRDARTVLFDTRLLPRKFPHKNGG